MKTKKAHRSVLGGMVGAAIAVAALLALSPSYAHAERRGIINMPVLRVNVPTVGLHTLRGSSDTTPPDTTSNTGGNTSTNQSDGPTGQDGNPSGTTGGNGNNGATQAGNGGNGGDGGAAATGGLVRAGNVVSNANALNMLNTVIVRISTR